MAPVLRYLDKPSSSQQGRRATPFINLHENNLDPLLTPHNLKTIQHGIVKFGLY